MQIQEDNDNAKNASSLPSPDVSEKAVQLHVTMQHVDSTHDPTLEEDPSDKHEQSVSDDKEDDAAASKATEEESGNGVQNIPSPGAETTSEENPIVNIASEQITTTEG